MWQKTALPTCHPLGMDSSDLDPHLIYGYLGHESAPKWAVHKFIIDMTAILARHPSWQKCTGPNSNRPSKSQTHPPHPSRWIPSLTTHVGAEIKPDMIEFNCSSPEMTPHCWCPWCSHGDPFAHLSTHPEHITILIISSSVTRQCVMMYCYIQCSLCYSKLTLQHVNTTLQTDIIKQVFNCPVSYIHHTYITSRCNNY